MAMRFIWIEADTPEELETVTSMVSRYFSADEKRPMTNAERCKKYRDSKKERVADMSDCVENVSKHVENVSNDTKEERGEKEEILPLDSPSSLSSSPLQSPIINPITPFNPPLPEEKEEKEESVVAAGAAKRGALCHFGEFVLLSVKEHEALINDYGFAKAQEMIEKMNSYIGEDPKRQKIYKTRNHNLTIRNWIRKDEDQKEKQPKAKVTIPKSRPMSFAELGRLMDMQKEGNKC